MRDVEEKSKWIKITNIAVIVLILVSIGLLIGIVGRDKQRIKRLPTESPSNKKTSFHHAHVQKALDFIKGKIIDAKTTEDNEASVTTTDDVETSEVNISVPPKPVMTHDNLLESIYQKEASGVVGKEFVDRLKNKYVIKDIILRTDRTYT